MQFRKVTVERLAVQVFVGLQLVGVLLTFIELVMYTADPLEAASAVRFAPADSIDRLATAGAAKVWGSHHC
jgi:hypothetical protein